MIIKLPSTWIQQLPYFRMKVPAKVRVVFRQIKQFGVKFHFPPYWSPHWPPNNGFQNCVPKSLVSKQNCSAIFEFSDFESQILPPLLEQLFIPGIDTYYIARHFFSNSCVTQLKLYTLEKLSSTIFCCVCV